MADGIVSNGQDIPNAEVLFEKLQGQTKVKLFFIREEEITEMDNKKLNNIVATKSIMKIGQVILQPNTTLKSRTLSCFCKKFPAVCGCHGPGDMNIIAQENITQKRSILTELKPNHILECRKNNTYEIGKWVLARYNNTLYPGILTDINEITNEYEVNVLYSVGENKYVWPTKQDKIWYPSNDICYAIDEPKYLTKRVMTFLSSPWLNSEITKTDK